jgi:hypothetical protein
MNEEEFKEIGKRLPYSVPDGFFSGIAEKTLAEARKREHARVVRIRIWRSVVAASLIVAAWGTYYLLTPARTPEMPIVAQQIHRQPQDTGFREAVTPVGSKKPEEPQTPEPRKDIAPDAGAEEIGPLLERLTDEELLELAAMYKADSFMETSTQ